MKTKAGGQIRITPVLLALAAGTVLIFSACNKNEGEVKPVVTVQTAVVQKGDIVQTVETEATLFPIQQAAITPKISAPVSRFFVNRGQKVQKGQLLARLENRDLAAAELENKGGFEQAEANYSTATKGSLPEEWKKAELDVNAAKQSLDAEQKLYNSREELFKEGALPRKELDAARVALTQARNQFEIAQQHFNVLQAVGKKDQLKSASGQLAAAQGKYLGAKALLGYSEIRSPINGWVADRPLYEGETATAGTPLITVIDSSRVIAKAHIPQEQAALLKVGDSASLFIPGEANAFSGKVTVVSPAVDPNSTTVEVWAQFANPHQQLRAGTSAHLSIETRKITGATIVPTEALVNAGETGSAVFLVKDNVVHQTPVKVGIQQGKQAQILEGVTPGATVVTTGAYGLPDGAEIKVQSSEGNDKSESPGKQDD